MDPSRQSSANVSTIMPRDMGLVGRLLWKLKESDAEGSFLYLMAVAVGLAMGLVSTAFRWMVLHSHELFSTEGHGSISVSRVLPENLSLGFKVISPALGGLLVGLLVYRLLKLHGGHGVANVMKAVATGKTSLPASMAIKSATSPITITSGGSSGPEGPIVEIGAVIGSIIARRAHARRDQAGTLIGCGAAAGIAAVFNAPLGGVVFALELIIRDMQVRRFAPVVVSAVVASVVSAALMPRHPAFEPLSDAVLGTIEPSFFLFGQFSVLGVLCGLAAVLLVSVVYKLGDVFNSIKIPLWTKPAVGGLFVGAIGLFLPQVMGEGNEFVNAMILREAVPEQGVKLILVFLAVAFFKTVATALTVGSGGTGGVFAPAMVTGAFTGAAIGILAEKVFPNSAPHYHVFAMTGMAGVVSSALGTPLAATLIVFEVAGSDYELMLPLMITVAVSSLLTARMKKGSVYTISLLRDGFDVDQSRAQRRDPLLDIRVGDIMATKFVSLLPGDSLGTIFEILGETDDNAFVVRDAGDRLVGVISTNDLRAIVNLGEIGGAAIIAQDVADTNPPTLPPDATAARALEIFTSSDTEGIPVVEPGADRRVVGLVSRAAVLQAYRKAAGEK